MARNIFCRQESAENGDATQTLGGKLTRDVIQGYGPEMYLPRTAAKGTYNIRVKYFASDRSRASTRTKVYVTIYQHWDTPKETVIKKVASLEYGKEIHDLATVVIKEPRRPVET